MMKPSIPKGSRDFTPEVVYKRNYILKVIQSVFELYGFQPIETPAMENLNTLLGKYGEEGDRLIFKVLNNGLNNPNISEKTKSAFQNVLEGKSDVNISERALRYDLTIPFARYVAMHQNEIAFPFRRYQMQPVWRADRPQKGRYREFWQCDADVIGSNSLINEAELISIYRSVFERLSLPQITLRINNRKVLAGLAENCGCPEKMMEMTIAIDKLDKVGLEGVEKELNDRFFTEEQIDFIKGYLIIKGDVASKIEQMSLYLKDSEIAQIGIQELKSTLEFHRKLEDSSWSSKIDIDFTLARGLNYYTGFIIEVITDAVKMGSIGGGGRYDDLTGLFGLKNISGVGISFGIDRIYDVIEELDLFPKKVQNITKLIFLNIDSNAESDILNYIRLLRNKNIAVEYYSEKGKLDKQMKYAHKRNIPFVALVGEKELEVGSITLKNMLEGTQESLSFEELIEKI